MAGDGEDDVITNYVTTSIIEVDCVTQFLKPFPITIPHHYIGRFVKIYFLKFIVNCTGYVHPTPSL